MRGVPLTTLHHASLSTYTELHTVWECAVYRTTRSVSDSYSSEISLDHFSLAPSNATLGISTRTTSRSRLPMPLQVIAGRVWGFLTPWLQDAVRQILDDEHPRATREHPFVAIHVRRTDKVAAEHRQQFETIVSAFMPYFILSITVELIMPGIGFGEYR